MLCLTIDYLYIPLNIKNPYDFRAKKRFKSKGSLKLPSFGLKRYEMAMVASMTAVAKGKDTMTTSTVMLMSGASGRTNALLYLRAWKNLLVVINAFVLLLFLPFRSRKVVSPAAVMGPGSQVGAGGGGGGGGEKGKGNGKEEKQGEKKGDVPAAMVPQAAVDEEVAARRALAIKRVMEDDSQESVREYALFGTARGDTLFTQSWTPVDTKVR